MPVLLRLRFFPLLALPVAIWGWWANADRISSDIEPEKVNLALRRTADGLLRLAGDSTSRIPAIRHTGARSWSVRLEQDFSYARLPAMLQGALEQYGIRHPYRVAIRRCEDHLIDLGYQQIDFLRQDSFEIPCSGRDMPEGCHYIEVIFNDTATASRRAMAAFGGLLLFLGAVAGYNLARRKSPARDAAPVETDANWVNFGHSRLHATDQILFCNGQRQDLTFREAKLLRLFVQHTNQLLERDTILRLVWADEGILVGRSVDMFVSRLRKKLASDPAVNIVAVHGVGYRMEVQSPA